MRIIVNVRIVNAKLDCTTLILYGKIQTVLLLFCLVMSKKKRTLWSIVAVNTVCKNIETEFTA